MPTAPDHTLWSLLGLHADRDAEAVLLAAPEGVVTREEMRLRAGQLAAGLVELGVRQADRVAVHAANRVEHLELLFALNAIGATYCPIHPDLRGSSLRHVVDLLEPAAAFVDADRADRWGPEAASGGFPRVLLDDGVPGPEGSIPFSGLRLDAEVREAQDPSAPALILMTSGTTGRSKGVLISSRFALSTAKVNVRKRAISSADRLHTAYSFCHTNPHCFTFFPALVAGASMSWSQRFSVSRFWSELRSAGVTQFSLFTAPMLMLLGSEPTEHDRTHGASVCLSIGTPRGRGMEFEDRFGVRLVEAYGMTECGAITFQPEWGRRIESAGKPVEEWDVRVVDASQETVMPGQVGEIVGRPLRRGMLMDGYFRDERATLETLTDLWFHTNDLGYFDEDGYLWYVGRAKDVIRYRGENISAADVEETVRATKLVEDVAAVALSSELGEDDLLLVVVPTQANLDPQALYAALARDLPRYCLPRHIRFVPELPRTMTGRVVKDALRTQGVTADTWTQPTARVSA